MSSEETISLSVSQWFYHQGIKWESHRSRRMGAVGWSAWGFREDKLPVAIHGSIKVRETTLWVSIVAVWGTQLRAGWTLVHQNAQFLLAQFQKLMYWGKGGWLESKRELGASTDVMHRRRRGCTGHFSYSGRRSGVERGWGLIVRIHLLGSIKSWERCGEIRIPFYLNCLWSKSDLASFKRFLREKKNGVFLFVISSFVQEIFNKFKSNKFIQFDHFLHGITQLNIKIMIKSEITSKVEVLEKIQFFYCFFLFSVAWKIRPAANLLIRGSVLLKGNDNLLFFK